MVTASSRLTVTFLINKPRVSTFESFYLCLLVFYGCSGASGYSRPLAWCAATCIFNNDSRGSLFGFWGILRRIQRGRKGYRILCIFTAVGVMYLVWLRRRMSFSPRFFLCWLPFQTFMGDRMPHPNYTNIPSQITTHNVSKRWWECNFYLQSEWRSFSLDRASRTSIILAPWVQVQNCTPASSSTSFIRCVYKDRKRYHYSRIP